MRAAATPVQKKEQIISLLTKINGRDTQKRATDELQELVLVSWNPLFACEPNLQLARISQTRYVTAGQALDEL